MENTELTEQEKMQDEIYLRVQEQVKGFEEKAETLSKTLNTQVTFEHFLKKDDNGMPTGEILVAYIRQPHILVAARAMDMMVAQKYYEVGNMLWNSCFLADHSSKEIADQNKYKLGLMGRLGFLLQIELPEVKKN